MISSRAVAIRSTSAAVLLALVWGCGSTSPSNTKNPIVGNSGGTAGTSGGTSVVSAGGTAGTTGAGGTDTSSGGAAGTTGAGGTNATGGGAGTGPIVIGASGLPVPPGEANLPQPSGTAGNLTIMDWAGFTAAATFTIDDSAPSAVAHEPDVTATGVPVTWYINSSQSYISGYVDAWKRAVAAGSEIGNHTENHPGFDAGTADAEIDACSDFITNDIGQTAVWTMAYPFGDGAYKPDAEERFFLARGIGGGTIAPNDTTDPFGLPTNGPAGGESASTFTAMVDSAHAAGTWQTFLFHGLTPNAESWEFAQVPIETLTGTIEYAKGLGDVWVDSMVNVGAYWLGQKTLSAVTPAGDTWTWTLPAHFPPGKYLRVTVDGGTLKQGETTLEWDAHGYYEVALDAGTLTLSP